METGVNIVISFENVEKKGCVKKKKKITKSRNHTRKIYPEEVVNVLICSERVCFYVIGGWNCQSTLQSLSIGFTSSSRDDEKKKNCLTIL